MTPERDPERNETKVLRRLIDFTGKRVLEVGCGEGRLTWRDAGPTRHVTGIDPDRDGLRVAMVDRPASLSDKIDLVAASAYTLPFAHERFDIEVLAWSL